MIWDYLDALIQSDRKWNKTMFVLLKTGHIKYEKTNLLSV